MDLSVVFDDDLSNGAVVVRGDAGTTHVALPPDATLSSPYVVALAYELTGRQYARLLAVLTDPKWPPRAR